MNILWAFGRSTYAQVKAGNSHHSAVQTLLWLLWASSFWIILIVCFYRKLPQRASNVNKNYAKFAFNVLWVLWILWICARKKSIKLFEDSITTIWLIKMRIYQMILCILIASTMRHFSCMLPFFVVPLNSLKII